MEHTENNLKRTLIALLLVFVALASFLLIGAKTTSPEAHRSTIASIDEKAETVLTLTATSTLASAGISAIPGDTATPIAEKLADFTEYFLVILCVLYAEKYLLTIIGAAAFKILIPCACAAGIVALFWNPKVMKRLAIKLAVFGLAIFIMIPFSIRVSDMIYDTYSKSFDRTITTAEDFTDKTDALAEAEDAGLIEKALMELSESVSSLSEKASRVLNNFVESLAVMIVTSCVIPILVLVFFIWLIKVLTGIELQLPHRRKGERKHAEAKED